jgi:hypothetical protein
MGKLVEEVREWNSPVVGAYLLWRFTQGYVKNHPHGDAPVAILHFIANTLLTSIDFNNSITGHRPNLASYIKAFTEDNRSDLLACLAQRIHQQREFAMKAIDIAVATGLLAWEVETAKLHPLNDFTPIRGSGIKGISVQATGKKAEILGKWFAKLDIHTVTSSLGVIL